MGLDHAAQGPAGVHNWRGWMISVGIEEHHAERCAERVVVTVALLHKSTEGFTV